MKQEYLSLVGPKSGNVDKVIYMRKGARGILRRRRDLREERGIGGGRGSVNLPSRRLVWRFWRVWRVWKLLQSLYMPGSQRPWRIPFDYVGGYMCVVRRRTGE